MVGLHQIRNPRSGQHLDLNSRRACRPLGGAEMQPPTTQMYWPLCMALSLSEHCMSASKSWRCTTHLRPKTVRCTAANVPT
jgi:hypothetical protein